MKDLTTFIKENIKIKEAFRINKNTRLDHNNTPKLVTEAFRVISFERTAEQFDNALKDDDIYIKGKRDSKTVINYIKKWLLDINGELNVDDFDIHASKESKEFLHKNFKDKLSGRKIEYDLPDYLSLKMDIYIPGYFSIAVDKEQLIIYIFSEMKEDWFMSLNFYIIL